MHLADKNNFFAIPRTWYLALSDSKIWGKFEKKRSSTENTKPVNQIKMYFFFQLDYEFFNIFS